MADQSLFNTSGIPTMLTLAQVNMPRCLECGSIKTYILESVAPFTYRPIRNRLCENCGRVTSAYADPVGVNNHGTEAQDQGGGTQPARQSEAPYLRGAGQLRPVRRVGVDRGHRLPGV